MPCPHCGAETRPGRKFCSTCGNRIDLACPSCGAPLEPDDRFCGECGTTLKPGAAPLVPVTQAAPDGAASGISAERRFVSVLFADLVGFTTLSERRDAEEVRELLTKYFDTCRRLIGLYGGTVEKFIGDAVMAVWGTPVAQEDDAERAVRAALDLTDAVSALGAEVGSPELRARAGVLTGEAAVTVGAEGQGMVAGDMVNTASRIQSAADPGTVLVGEATRRASEAAIDYEDAGAHELKGKAEPVRLWRAVRVVAGRGGAMRTAGLEAPFVGRDREMRLVKELYHSSAEQHRVHLVSVMGIAGIGKSRLAWEFEKYLDGLAEEQWWHRGRCVAYGEGVTYWALAEMVRMRARIVEGEDAASAAAKVQQMLESLVSDPEERRWIESRMAHLLGLEERAGGEATDLFAAWRLFFERLAQEGPVLMVFEDLQWADAALLDFIEYMLEWSRDYPIFVLTLARPELSDRRPTWGAGKREFTSLFLDPLSAEAMEELLRGLLPGLPEQIGRKILDRAEGVPLYAVETARMLLDRGVVVAEDGQYRVTGSVEDLDVPETLHALIAARLDGLTAEERSLLQDAAVLGKTFTKGAIGAVTRLSEADLDGLLASLIRKEFLSLQADPRSPERGQYGFLQDLVRRVAYETLSHRDRKLRHLAAAASLEDTWGGEADEIVEVLMAHYLEAYRLAPDAPDAAEIKAKARDRLIRSGQRAASLGAANEAQRYFEQAIELADEPLLGAELRERAGEAALLIGRLDNAEAHFATAIQIFEAEDQPRRAARASTRLAESIWGRGRLHEAMDRMEKAFKVLSAVEPDEDLAALAAQIGRFHFFLGQMEQAMERVQQALEISEALRILDVLANALITKAVLLVNHWGRQEEPAALFGHALQIALSNDVPQAALRAYANLCDMMTTRDRYEAAVEASTNGLALARKLGDRYMESFLLSNMISPLFLSGRWGEVLDRAGEIPELQGGDVARLEFLDAIIRSAQVHVHRGDLSMAQENLALFHGTEESGDLQTSVSHALVRATVLRAEGRHEEALAAGQEAFGHRVELGPSGYLVREGFVEAVDAAFAVGNLDKAKALMSAAESLRPGETTMFLQAQVVRFRARLAASAGNEANRAEAQFKEAAGIFREIVTPFWLGVTLLEYGEWLEAQGRPAAEPLEEARTIFDRLEARPWLDRLERTTGAVATAARGRGP